MTTAMFDGATKTFENSSNPVEQNVIFTLIVERTNHYIELCVANVMLWSWCRLSKGISELFQNPKSGNLNILKLDKLGCLDLSCSIPCFGFVSVIAFRYLGWNATSCSVREFNVYGIEQWHNT